MFKPFTRDGKTWARIPLTRTLSKLSYYIVSILRLLVGIKQPWRTVAIFLGREPLRSEIELRGSGLRFRIRDRMDAWIAKETCLDDVYFPRWVSAESLWRVIDIGGGIGDFTVLMARRCPRGVVHVYEPSPDSFEVLLANVKANGANNVVAQRHAVSAEACRMAPEADGASHALTARFTKGGGGEPEVEAVSLASVLDALPDGECDFMKIDCEGGEFDLLLESDPALLRRVHRISLEFHDGVTRYSGADIAEHLESHGFRVWAKRNPVHPHLGQLYAERTKAESVRLRTRAVPG